MNKKIYWGTLVSSYLSLFTVSFLDNLRGPLFPYVLSDFQVGQGVGAWFYSTAAITQVATTALGKFWIPYLPSMRGLRFFLLVQAFGYLIMALAPRMHEYSWPLLLIGAAFFGVSLGSIGILQSTLIADATPLEYQRRAFSGLHGMFGSSILAPLLVPFMIGMGFQWSDCLLWSTAMPLALFAGTFLVRQIPSPSVKKGEKIPMPWKHVWIPVMMAMYVCVEVSITSRLVLYVETELGRSSAEAARLLSLFFLGVLIVRVFLTVVPLKFRTSHILFAAFVATLGLYIAGLSIDPIFLALAGCTMAPVFPMAMTLVSEEAPNEIDGLTALTMTFVACGLVFMHSGLGLLSDYIGLSRALYAGPIMLSLVIVLLLSQQKRPRTRDFQRENAKNVGFSL